VAHLRRRRRRRRRRRSGISRWIGLSCRRIEVVAGEVVHLISSRTGTEIYELNKK
jgi:hypothetical protein